VVCTICLVASGQEIPQFGAKQSLGVTASYSPTSGHILIGISQQRRTITAGVEYTRRLLEGQHARLDYSGEFSPFYRESDPTMVATEVTLFGITNVTPVTPQRVIWVGHASLGAICGGGDSCSYIYPVYGHDETTYGVSVSPLGARVVLRPFRRIQPTFAANLGAVISTRDLPIDQSALFNYQFTFGPGVQVFASRSAAMRLEYVYRHISNAGVGATNPGIDQGVFRLTLSRYR
jgi:hypothetical protein